MEHAFTSLSTEQLNKQDAYRLLTSIVIPRPIAWVSTCDHQGETNIAPFSFFNAVAGSPPTIMFSVGKRGNAPKDTLRNIEATGEFVVNMVDEAHAHAMNLSSADVAGSEFEVIGIPARPAAIVRPPLVADAPVAMEARLSQLVPVKDTSSVLVLGQVIYFHFREDWLTQDGILDVHQTQLIGRLSGNAYTSLGEIFTLERP